MIRLSDTQRILLSCASQRSNGSLLPLPPVIRPGGGTARAMAALLRHGFVHERETGEPGATHRVDDDIRYGVFLTAAGAAAIGVEPEDPGAATAVAVAGSPAASATRPHSKTATIITLLARAQGATAAELIEATGWLPHTTRAALTGIRKKGHAIDRGKREGVTCYRIVEAG